MVDGRTRSLLKRFPGTNVIHRRMDDLLQSPILLFKLFLAIPLKNMSEEIALGEDVVNRTSLRAKAHREGTASS